MTPHGGLMATVTFSQIDFRDFLSFHDAVLPLQRLTVLVGANAWGQTNTIKGLQLLQSLLRGSSLCEGDWLGDQVWAGGDKAGGKSGPRVGRGIRHRLHGIPQRSFQRLAQRGDGLIKVLVWAVESEYDAKAVDSGLSVSANSEKLRITTNGKQAFQTVRRGAQGLEKAVIFELKRFDFVVFIYDRDILEEWKERKQQNHMGCL